MKIEIQKIFVSSNKNTICWWLQSFYSCWFGWRILQRSAPRQYMEYVTLALVLLNAFLLTLEFQIEGEVVGESLVEGQESLGHPFGTFFSGRRPMCNPESGRGWQRCIYIHRCETIDILSMHGYSAYIYIYTFIYIILIFYTHTVKCK